LRHSKNILVAPLNWGLGHATRCIPIIRELQKQHAEVSIASDGRALNLLQAEFPNLHCLQLPPYGISYHSDRIIRNIGGGMPKLIRAVYKENQAVKRYVKEYQIDGIISDNRLGCFNTIKPSVFLTHQIDLILPNRFLEKTGRWMNHQFIHRFDQCWVPDVAEEPSLSGNLSHGTSIKNITYLGAISRMENKQVEKRYDAIAVISGPEPQRTKFEKSILEQAARLAYKLLVVEGKPDRGEHYFIGKNVEVISFLTTAALNEAILASSLFIGRTGYSSIMDLAKLRKPALLIPTPGQTEQEYLGDRLFENGTFQIQAQNMLDLKSGIPAALANGVLSKRYFDDAKLEAAIKGFLQKTATHQ